MKIQTFFILLVSGALICACNSSKDTQGSITGLDSSFNGEWKLTNSWVFDSTLVFEKIDKTVERPEYEEVFIIEGKSIKHEVRTELGMCGNGMFYLDSALFKPAAKEVEMELYGGYMVESTFKYNATYTVKDKSEDGFTLLLKRISLDEGKSLYE